MDASTDLKYEPPVAKIARGLIVVEVVMVDVVVDVDVDVDAVFVVVAIRVVFMNAVVMEDLVISVFVVVDDKVGVDFMTVTVHAVVVVVKDKVVSKVEVVFIIADSNFEVKIPPIQKKPLDS